MFGLLFIGVFFVLWSLLCFYYFRVGEVKPFFMVISRKTIDNYKDNRGFDDARILTAVQVQGTIFFIIGGIFLFAAFFKYFI